MKHYITNIVTQNLIIFVNYSVIDHELLNKIIYDVGKLQRAHPTLRGHFASAYLVGSNMLRAYLFFIYGLDPQLPSLPFKLQKNRFKNPENHIHTLKLCIFDPESHKKLKLGLIELYGNTEYHTKRTINLTKPSLIYSGSKRLRVFLDTL